MLILLLIFTSAYAQDTKLLLSKKLISLSETPIYSRITEDIDGQIEFKKQFKYLEDIDIPSYFGVIKLKDIADIHACWYRKEKTLCESTWHLAFENSESMLQKRPLWSALTKHAQDEFPHWFKAEYAQMNHQIIDELPQWYRDIDQMPKTLIHNDFNPRNITFKRKGEAIKLCAFDWELSAIGIPQRDLAELLAFTLSTKASEATVSHYIQYHRQQLERFLGVSLDPVKWRKGYFCALKEFTISRLPFYTLGHTFKEYVFLEKVCATTYHLLALEIQFAQEKHEALTC